MKMEYCKVTPLRLLTLKWLGRGNSKPHRDKRINL